MPTSTDEIRLRIIAEGKQELVRLESDANKLRVAMGSLDAQLASGAINAAKHTREMAKLSDQMRKLLRDTRKVGGEITALESEMSVGGPGKKGAWGRGGGMMSLAYFVDDMQYGMRGIANQIPQMLMMLGMGGGLAGAISIVATLFTVLTRNGSSSMQIIGDSIARAIPFVDQLADRLSKLKNPLDEVAETLDPEAYRAGKIRERTAYLDEAKDSRVEGAKQAAVDYLSKHGGQRELSRMSHDYAISKGVNRHNGMAIYQAGAELRDLIDKAANGNKDALKELRKHAPGLADAIHQASPMGQYDAARNKAAGDADIARGNRERAAREAADVKRRAAEADFADSLIASPDGQRDMAGYADAKSKGTMGDWRQKKLGELTARYNAQGFSYEDSQQKAAEHLTRLGRAFDEQAKKLVESGLSIDQATRIIQEASRRASLTEAERNIEDKETARVEGLAARNVARRDRTAAALAGGFAPHLQMLMGYNEAHGATAEQTDELGTRLVAKTLMDQSSVLVAGKHGWRRKATMSQDQAMDVAHKIVEMNRQAYEEGRGMDMIDANTRETLLNSQAMKDLTSVIRSGINARLANR